MVIELRGVEFHNKGAQLMLLSILEKVRKEYPNAIFTMEKRTNVSEKDMRNHNIKTKYRFKKRNFDLSFLGHFFPKSYRTRNNIILDHEINIVLDGSGFAYGDFWGAEKCYNRLSKNLVKWKSQGKKVILLPQAFGPFENPKLRREMEKVIKHCDLIFTRDKYSNEHVLNLLPDVTNVFLKPDFTNLIKGKLPNRIVLPKIYTVIIPNFKMIESKVFEDRNKYINFLKYVVNYFQERGRNPVFLNHEGQKDYELMVDVNALLTQKIPLINEKDPLVIKGVISSASGILTSRFHGLVSGLSQNVPSLCLGWSHKYLALLEDYGVEQLLISEEDIQQDLLDKKLNLIINEDSRLKLENALKVSSSAQKELSNGMWNQIFSLINK